MSVTVTRETGVNRPAVSPMTSSVLDHATVTDISSFGLRNNEGLWPSYSCMTTRPVELCDPAPEPKTFETAGWVPAFETAVYGGAVCNAVGFDAADAEAEVKRVFLANEGRGVEEALRAYRFEATGSGQTPAWSAPTEVTPAGGAASLLIALAMLEGHAAANYAGIPTIHMPRAAATILGDKIVWVGDKAFTRNGSKVALGGGYDDQTMLDTGVWEMFATGEVYVERSDLISVQTYTLPGQATPENGRADNEVLVLAERMYRVAIDCYVAKATGKVF